MNKVEEREPKTGKDSYDIWHGRVEAALHFRKHHWNGDKAWKRAYRLFRGDHWGVMNADTDDVSSLNPRERATVNLVGSNVRSALSFVLNKNPRALAKPRRIDFLVAAALQQEILNYEWRERRMKKQAKRAVLDAAICGHGVVKTGFVLELDETINPDKDGNIVYEDYVKKEAPFIKRVSPFRFIHDPEAPEYDLESARWCAEIFFKPPKDVVKNKRYDSAIIKKIIKGEYSPGSVPAYTARALEGISGGLSADFTKEDKELWLLYEVWDKKFQKYYVFADGVREPLVEQAWPYPYLDGFPYIQLNWIDIPDELFPLGIPAWIEDQQFELNRVRTRWFQHGRRFNRKYEALEGSLSPEAMAQLQFGEDGTVIEVEALNAIRPIDDANVSSDQQIIEGQIKQDIRELTGFDELARGGNLPSRTTATEVQTRTGLLNLKTDEAQDKVDDFITEIFTQTNQHCKANYVTKKVIKITGLKGSMWVSYTNEDIQGETDVDIETSAAPKTDPNTEMQQALQVFQLIMQNLPAILPVYPQLLQQLNIVELMRWVLEKVGPKDCARFFMPLQAVQQPITEQAPGQGQPQEASSLTPDTLADNPGQINAQQLGAMLGQKVAPGVSV